jgi:uncharacterized protein (DUF58 family)
VIFEICKNRNKVLLDVKSRVKSMLAGEHPSRYMGLGVEYENVREYMFGDDYRRIDWNITARTPTKPTGERPLFIRQFREEKNLDVLLILDQSGSMEYREKVPTAIRVALVLADLAQRRSDHVGLVCFRDKAELFLTPSRSTSQAYRILRTLCLNYRTGGTSSLRTLAVEVVRALRRRAVVNLITDVNHDVADYVFFAHLMWAREHMTNLLLVVDESEMNLPNVGWLTLMESEELQRITIDTDEFKEEYDMETRGLITRMVSGCKMFGSRVLMFKGLKDVDAKILEIASLYRHAREGAYR